MSMHATAPSLRAASPSHARPAGIPSSAQVFSVARDGEFGGRSFRSGELVIVSGTPEQGDSVVLVARGPGRPMLGRVDGLRLLGDHGEPCLLSRWSVAGRLVGVVRSVGSRWSIEWFGASTAQGAGGEAVDASNRPMLAGDSQGSVASGLPAPANRTMVSSRGAVRAASPVEPTTQLSLFAA